MVDIPFPLQSEPAPFKFMGDARLINVYPEKFARGSKRPVGFLSIPGQTSFKAVTSAPSRGMLPLAEESLLYSVHGMTLYRITEAAVATAVTGNIAGSKPVIMDRGPEHYQNSTVTITIASPGVVTWRDHRLAAGTPLQFSTDGALPDGIDANTTYYVLAASLADNSFRFSDSAGGTAINTSGTQSGTHTATRTVATYQVAIVSDANAYVSEDGKLYQLALPETGNSVTVLDNRFIYGHDSGRFYWSELNDARTIDALSYATAEARPDGLVRAFAHGGELYLQGKTTTEIWTGSTDASAPFVKLQGAFINKGLGAKHTSADFDNALHWVGHDWVVYRAQGYEAQRVSTHAVERAIESVADKDTIKGYVDASKGHLFYVLTCPSWTWVLDAATGVWHERKSYQREYWRAWPYAAIWGKRLVCDTAAGTLLELSDTAYNENGRHIRCELILPDIPGRYFFHRLDLNVSTGYGLNVASTAAGYDPQIMLDWSDDGGHVWSNEQMRPTGKQGEFGKLVRFTGLGMSEHNGRRFRIACSEPTVKAFYLMDVDADRAEAA